MSSTTKKAQVRISPASNRALRRAQQQQARQRKLMLLGGAILIALIVVAGLIALNRSTGGSSGLPAIVAAGPIDASIPQNGRVLGDPNAPVTIVEYADYQCPFCGEFYANIEPSLINDYIKNGKVKLEFRDLPFLDDSVSTYGESDMAAEAAACALDQGKFWEFHDTLYANQHGENEGAFTKDRIKQIAQVVGLDITTFNSCFDNRTHKDDVAAMKTEAEQAGVDATPTLFLNGKEMSNPLTYADVKSQIDAALAG
jgi:protein-disulfide isomerase